MNNFIEKILILILVFTTITFGIEWEDNKLLDRISFTIDHIDHSSLVTREYVCPSGSGLCPNYRCCPLNSFCARGGGCCPLGNGQCPNGACVPPNSNCCIDQGACAQGQVCVLGGCCPIGFGRCIDGSRKCCPLAPTKAPPKEPPKGPGESLVWKSLNPYRGKIRTDGRGKNKKYYQWDYTHNDIEVYDSNGKHLGSMDPVSGDMIKPPVKGRKINI